MLNNIHVKLHRSELVEGDFKTYAPATIVNADNLTIACGDGNAVRITELQPQGKRRMKTEDYLRGNKLSKGIIVES